MKQRENRKIGEIVDEKFMTESFFVGKKKCMKKVLHKISVRLTEEDVLMIKQYPGTNISEKVRSLLAMHKLLISKIEGIDLVEKYEILLQGYLSEFAPELEIELKERRKELKKYVETIDQIDHLQEAVGELHHDIEELSRQSSDYIEKIVTNCVVVQKPKKENRN